MKTPTRPVGVPEEAVWTDKDKCWQLGTSEKRGFLKKVEVPVGEWRYWREDGSLCCIANFDLEGNQHGLVERFHKDGTLASRGEWKNGNRHGHFVFIQSENETDESYGASYKTWRFEFDSTANWEEHNVQWFLKDGTECTSDGRPLADAYDLDKPILESNPSSFLKTDAKNISLLLDPSREAFQPEKDPHQLEELWGVTVPEIDDFVNNTAKSDPFIPVTERRMFEKNIWESLIAHPWENINEEIGMAFVGATKICFLSDSDHAYATIFQPRMEEPAPNAVIMWDHDTHYINEVLSLSLDEFAYRAAISSAFQEERISRKAAKKAWQKLEGKCYVGYFLCEGLDESDDTEEEADRQIDDEGDEKVDENSFDREKYRVDLEPEYTVTGRFWRAHWIIELLRADRDRDWSTVKECFRPGWNKPLNEVYESLKQSGNERIYPTALYLLWRLFWFDQQVKLKECCDLYRNHPARIVRDLVVLLEEIGNGRKQIGDIKDILAVRDEFLALDLSPERREEREQEVAQKAEGEVERVKAIADQVEKLAESGLSEILDRAWACVTDTGAMAQYEKAARKIGGNEIQWKCFDWVHDGLYRRDNIDATDEAEGIGIWLGQNGCEILQPFIWASVYSGHFQTADLLLPAIGKAEEALDPRLTNCCLNQLDVPEEYNIIRTLAVELLGIMGVSSAVPRLCKLVDEYFEEIGNKQDFEARLAAIPWESLLVETARALEKLATTTTTTIKEYGALVRKTLRKLLEHAAKEYQHNLCAPVLNALVAWGETDLLPLIGKLLRANDTTIQVSALRALETLAAKLDPKARRNFVAMEFRNPSDVDNAVTLMYYRAANALLSADPKLGETNSISDALEEARQLSTYGVDLWHQWRIIECETVGKFADLDIQSIAHYLQSSNSTIREAAEAAYTARGAEFPRRIVAQWPHVWSAIEHSEQSLPAAQEAVTELLMENSVVNHSAPAAWLWENPGASSVPALCAIVERKLKVLPKVEPGEYLPQDYLWVLRALAKHSVFPDCANTVKSCLTSEREEVAAALIHDIDSIPVSFAPQLLSLASKHDGWHKYAIAKWAVKRKEDTAVSNALKSAGITTKTLKSWAN